MTLNYIDIVVVVIIAFFSAWGYKRGFVKSIVGILSLATSFILAWLMYPIISQLLETFGVKTAIYESIQNVLYENMQNNSIETLPKFLQNAVIQGQQGIVDSAALGAAKMVLDIASFIVVLILSRVIIWIAKKLLIVVSQMPIISFFNRVAGLMLGAIEGVMIVFILFTVVFAISPLRDNVGIVEAINTSTVAKSLYEANPIVDIFDSGDEEEFQSQDNGE